jgi:polyhydroxyalkanoate synthase
LLRSIGEPVALIGYCLGGTMAIAAANLIGVERVVTLAAPWNFACYPESSKSALQNMWRHSEAAAKSLGALPMEVLQAAFWSLDPERTVRKFAEFGRLDPASAESRRFIELEEWANEGEPLPYPAAKELVEGLFGEDWPGSGRWAVAGNAMSDRISAPSLHLTAERDLIAPPQTVASGQVTAIQSGHVGMIVGSARERLHHALRAFISH